MVFKRVDISRSKVANNADYLMERALKSLHKNKADLPSGVDTLAYLELYLDTATKLANTSCDNLKTVPAEEVEANGQ